MEIVEQKIKQDNIIVTNDLDGILNIYIFSICMWHIWTLCFFNSQKVLPTIIDQFIKSFIRFKNIICDLELLNIKGLKSSFSKTKKDLSNFELILQLMEQHEVVQFLRGGGGANIGDSRSVNKIPNNQIQMIDKILKSSTQQIIQ
ncbi:unnamed protein product [Paramecium primaurelia]|uniref:Uncharacterized protein n=1 Tax=Paramecium primaurelia TaxID=5886 RepID=A0A8S1JPY3_PARPR|nr:unnamed protein product [Paramecium primaurelia]